MTILCWSFPREDVSRETIAKQIALALRDEVADLEAAGIGIIQIDEPALREGVTAEAQRLGCLSAVGCGSLPPLCCGRQRRHADKAPACAIASSMTSWTPICRAGR
ncbi:hypothetical protein MJ579_01665 [Klebsiella pneumoniae]|nr:hypothetical protein MJ579_01665 [Klebsiella pneumoniae]